LKQYLIEKPEDEPEKPEGEPKKLGEPENAMVIWDGFFQKPEGEPEKPMWSFNLWRLCCWNFSPIGKQ
jgi:hypothetical protein